MMDRVELFWTRVTKGESCWEWQGNRNRLGYGVIRVEPGRLARRVLTHRFSWELHNGPIPSGLFVCHRCDNPPCVNPAHLFLGTMRDNTRDMMAKGRDAATPIYANRHKTHCIRGHEFTPNNTRIRPCGARECRECMRVCRRDWLRAKRRKAGILPRGEATHCCRGHKYTPDNIVLMSGSRTCRTCREASRRTTRARSVASLNTTENE